MATKNSAAVLYGINDLRIEPVGLIEPNDNEVLLEMANIGICGSDVHYLVHGRIGDFVVEHPMIIGHESSGTVTQLGKNVRHLNIGDRVAIEPGVPCKTCEFCKKGRYNLCQEIRFCATPPVHGSLRKFYTHAADFCYKLPDHVSLEEGALLEPLSVGVHACKRAEVGIGSNVLILGSGSIGLVTLLAAKAMGARKVAIADLMEYRLTLARKLEADAVYRIINITAEQENVDNICKLIDCQPDITIDASGAESSIRLAIRITKAGGKVILVGMGNPEMNIPLCDALIKELDIRGVFRYVNESISNVEDFGCPPLEEILSESHYFCFNHALCIRRKPMCAIHNVLSVRAWLLNYLEPTFGRDKIDISKKKNIECTCLYWK